MTPEQLKKGNKISGDIESMENQLKSLKLAIEYANGLIDEKEYSPFMDSINVLMFYGQRIFVNKEYILKRLKKEKKIIKSEIDKLKKELETL